MKTYFQFDEGARAALMALKGVSRLARRGNTKAVERALRRARKPQRSLVQTRHEIKNVGGGLSHLSSGVKADRSMNIMRSAAKRSGFPKSANRVDFNKPSREFSTYPDNAKIDYHPLHNTQIDTNIYTKPSVRVAAFGMNTTGKRVIPGKGVPKTQELVRKMKEYRRRIRQTGGNVRGQVHQVDFIPRSDATILKGEMDKYAMKRARNFRRAQEELPKRLKQAGANKGDVVQGVPAMMFGGEGKSSIGVRARRYQQRYGRRVTGLDKTNRTYGVIGAAGGELPKNQTMKPRRSRRRQQQPKSDVVRPSSIRGAQERMERDVF